MQVRKRKRRNETCAKLRVTRQNGNKEQLHLKREDRNWAEIQPVMKKHHDEEGEKVEDRLEGRDQKRPRAGSYVLHRVCSPLEWEADLGCISPIP